MLRLIKHYYWTTRKQFIRYRCERLPAGGRLHVGCGPIHIDGWINIDNRRYKAVDYIWDVRDGLPFQDLEYIFAEHFLEHLPYWEASRFLHDCRTALGDKGTLRLSTPNLHWVYETQYRPHTWQDDKSPIADCFSINKSFRGWGHQFLYNLPTLAALLHDAGFADVISVAYGESGHAALRNLERHEPSADGLASHVIVVEASGIRRGRNVGLGTPEADFLASLGAH